MPQVYLFHAIYGSFHLKWDENFKLLKEINNTKPSVRIREKKKIKFVHTRFTSVTEECRSINNMSNS